jgi:hypothetical protein
MSEASTMRRDAAAAGKIPVRPMPPRLAGRVSSEGHHPAHRRHAVRTRVHQSGGPPTYFVPAHGRVLLRAQPRPLGRRLQPRETTLAPSRYVSVEDAKDGKRRLPSAARVVLLEHRPHRHLATLRV